MAKRREPIELHKTSCDATIPFRRFGQNAFAGRVQRRDAKKPDARYEDELMETAFVKTPVGIARIEGDENGISAISILDDEVEITSKVSKNLKKAATELSEYFNGKRQDFTFLMNPKGTEFQKSVWNELLKIPFGKTTSYLDLSKKLGDVKAIRAVASANGKNPLWIVVPCHRVIGSDGSLTGYAGGLWRKKWLLEHETPSAQQSLF